MPARWAFTRCSSAACQALNWAAVTRGPRGTPPAAELTLPVSGAEASTWRRRAGKPESSEQSTQRVSQHNLHRHAPCRWLPAPAGSAPPRRRPQLRARCHAGGRPPGRTGSRGRLAGQARRQQTSQPWRHASRCTLSTLRQRAWGGRQPWWWRVALLLFPMTWTAVNFSRVFQDSTQARQRNTTPTHLSCEHGGAERLQHAQQSSTRKVQLFTRANTSSARAGRRGARRLRTARSYHELARPVGQEQVLRQER